MERVLGIGGYFMRAADPAALGAWYRDCLGLDADENGLWRQGAGPTVFATFESDSDYFGSRAQQTMLNFRVRDLDAMLAQLRTKGADVAEETQDMDGVGRFGWVTDPEWTLSPFLVAAASGLGEEALASEASEAAAGDVDGRLVGGHAEEFVQLACPECVGGVLVEGVHDGLVGGVRLGRFGFGSCRRDLHDDLSGGGQVREPRFGLGQIGGELFDPGA
ncbi:hypothetical protein OG871_02170 [Kitasatospora sp. NBC_00374]